MGHNAISISISDDERAFIEGQLAAGRYADEEELLHAGLAALKRQSLATASAVAGLPHAGFSEVDEAILYAFEDAEDLRRGLAESGASGVSPRNLRDIVGDVKAKLRANGAL